MAYRTVTYTRVPYEYNSSRMVLKMVLYTLCCLLSLSTHTNTPSGPQCRVSERLRSAKICCHTAYPNTVLTVFLNTPSGGGACSLHIRHYALAMPLHPTETFYMKAADPDSAQWLEPSAERRRFTVTPYVYQWWALLRRNPLFGSKWR